MQLIKTKSFELAVLTEGNPKSDRIAITLPGRLDTKDYANFPSHLKYLANKGYLAIAFDPPGTWDSPGPIDLFTTTNYIKAVNELIEHFGNQPTLLMGHSRGGTVAMLTAPKNPCVSHLIAINSSPGGPIDVDAPVPGEIRVTYRDMPPGKIRTKKQKRFDLPYKYFEDGNRHNALDGLKYYTKPKLFFFSTDDEFFGPKEGKQIVDVCAEPKSIHELNSKHDYRLNPQAIDEVNRTVGEFLQEYP